MAAEKTFNAEFKFINTIPLPESVVVYCALEKGIPKDEYVEKLLNSTPALKTVFYNMLVNQLSKEIRRFFVMETYNDHKNNIRLIIWIASIMIYNENKTYFTNKFVSK